MFKVKPEFKDEHKELITHLLRLDIIELEKLMDTDLSDWLAEDADPLPATHEPQLQ
ncbi:hypothetical protein ACG2F4_15560 [Halalkalibaculum sp. DA3122]|uniref:hypothetical protein n=1 Tax=unclassified Halalkalibaculum TaxID=2964617 RepID=UPI00375448A2